MAEVAQMTEREIWNAVAKEKGWKYIDRPGASYEQGWFHFIFLGSKYYLIFDRRGKMRFIESVKQSDVMTDRQKFDALAVHLKETPVVEQIDGGHYYLIFSGMKVRLNHLNQFVSTEKI